MRRSLKVKLSLIGAVLAAGAMADDIKANKGKADASFVEEAFVNGEAEVRLSQLALRQSSDPAVKQLAQQMVDDHTKANDQLRQVAESKGFVLPPSMVGATGSIGGSGSSGSMGSSTDDQGTVTGERMGAGDNRMGSGSTGSTGSTGSIGSGSAGSNTGSDTTGSGSVGSGSTGSDTAGSGSTASGSRGAGQAGSGSSGSGSSGTIGSSGSGASGSTGSASGTGSDTTGSGSTGSTGSSGSGTYGSRQGGSGSTGSGSVGSGSTGSGSVGSMAGMTSAQRQVMKKYDDISKKTGAEFDRAYLTQLIDDHKKNVRLYERESKSGTDSEFKTWATNTLPTLKHHLEMVQTIEKDVRGRRSNTM